MHANEFKKQFAYPVCFFVPFVLFVAMNIEDLYLSQSRRGPQRVDT